MRRYMPALLFSSLVVGMAPFAGEIREGIERVLAAGYVRWMGIGFGLAVAGVVGWVIARIRDDRPRRYGLLLAGLGLLVGQLVGWSRADAAVNAVERVHFLYYGVLGVLWLRAYRGRRTPMRDGSAQAPARGLSPAALAALLAVLLVAIADEGVQWLVAARTGELYDVVLNVYAGATGLLLGLALDGLAPAPPRARARSMPLLARLAAAAVVALAAFVDAAHLGHRIDDPAIGSFRSTFTAEELAAASRDRADRWRARPLGPPGEFAPLEPEDRFRSEAGMRVQHRNASLARGDVYQVWKENLILERYYAPFLEQRNRDGRPFRLPEETLRAVEEARPRHDPYPYDSPVGRVPLRIWTRPSKAVVWAVAAIAAVALLAVGRWGARHRSAD